MSQQSMHQIVLTELKDMMQMFLKDYDAMTDEALVYQPNPEVRTVFDFVYEMGFVHERMLKRVQQEDPGPWPFEGFVRAPEAYYNRDACRNYFATTGEALIKAFEEAPEAVWDLEFESPQGKFTLSKILVFALMHTSHHGGQLNYIQTLFGDDKMHWF